MTKLTECRYTVVVRTTGRQDGLASSEHARVCMGRPSRLGRLRARALHQHRVHGAQARRREGRSVPTADRDLRRHRT